MLLTILSIYVFKYWYLPQKEHMQSWSVDLHKLCKEMGIFYIKKQVKRYDHINDILCVYTV